MSRGGLGSSGGVQCAGRGFALSALADGRSAKRASDGFRKVWREEACTLRSVRRGRRTGGLVARAVSSEEEGNAKDAGEKRSTTSNRAYRITIRGREAFRYTIPDFFPDFNYAGPPDKRLSDEGRGTVEGQADKRESTYYWKRSVLAGVEASVPRERPVAMRDEAEAEAALLAGRLAPDPTLEEVATTRGFGSWLLGAITVLLFLAAFLLGILSASRDMLPADLTAPATVL